MKHDVVTVHVLRVRGNDHVHQHGRVQPEQRRLRGTARDRRSTGGGSTQTLSE